MLMERQPALCRLPRSPSILSPVPPLHRLPPPNPWNFHMTEFFPPAMAWRASQKNTLREISPVDSCVHAHTRTYIFFPLFLRDTDANASGIIGCPTQTIGAIRWDALLVYRVNAHIFMPNDITFAIKLLNVITYPRKREKTRSPFLRWSALACVNSAKCDNESPARNYRPVRGDELVE